MTHEDEYDDNMVTMLELIWGRGYMAPGGSGNVANLLEGIDTQDKHILDIGCGIGGPVFEMVRTHGATVVGIDLEAPLIERARQAADELKLGRKCHFETVTSGPLPYADACFDIVVSSGAITQTPDKTGIFSESFRVLKPGGFLSCYEWQGTGGSYSEDMHYWVKMEGLTYVLETLQEYRDRFLATGFVDVVTKDATHWYRKEARREYELISGSMYPELVSSLGRKVADHFVEDWRAMVLVIDKGEMRQGYIRGRRPDQRRDG